MANEIQNRITALGDHFIGFNIGNGNDGKQVIYLEVRFPENWGISSALGEKFGIKVTKSETPGNYYLFGALESISIDTLFDAAEYNIQANQEAEEKKTFLMEKINELKKLVYEEPLSVLKTLEFKFTKKSKKSSLSEIKEDKDVLPKEILAETEKKKK